jgi:hypothetical protein
MLFIFGLFNEAFNCCDLTGSNQRVINQQGGGKDVEERDHDLI